MALFRTLPITTAVEYFTKIQDYRGRENEVPQSVWSALKFVKGLKGAPFKGEGTAEVGSRRESFNQASVKKFPRWAAEMLTDGVPDEAMTLVLVPSSSCTIKKPTTGGQHAVAAVLATLNTLGIDDVLRWDQVMQKAHDGGTRNSNELVKHLCLVGKVPPGPLLVFDDVKTSGGHLIACAKFLESQGGKVIGGMAVARTVHELPDDAFSLKTERELFV